MVSSSNKKSGASLFGSKKLLIGCCRVQRNARGNRQEQSDIFQGLAAGIVFVYVFFEMPKGQGALDSESGVEKERCAGLYPTLQ